MAFLYAPIASFKYTPYNFVDCNTSNEPEEYLKIKNIVAGRRGIIVQSDDDAYVLQLERDRDRLNFKTYDPNTNVWNGGIFAAEDFEVNDFYQNQELDPSLPDSMNFNGVKGRMNSIIQCGDFAINLKNNVEKGSSWQEGLDKDEYVWEDLTVAVYDMKTLMSNPALNNTSTRYQLLSAFYTDDPYENTEIPPLTLSGINWSFLTDTPLNIEYFNFDDGKMFGSSFKAKTPWDENFNVNAKISEEISGGVVSREAEINKIRNYCKIGIGNMQPWLSYKHRDSYAGGDFFATSGDLKSNMLSPVNVSFESAVTSGIYAYDHIERITGSRRGFGADAHKSNIYSIKILDSGLNESIEDEQTRLQIQDGLNKVIRELNSRISPAHTQLWKIKWVGK